MAMSLEGIKVLDLSQLSPGFNCTMILGDYGAEVIMLERWPRQEEIAEEKFSRLSGERLVKVAYDTFNRNKKSIFVNLKSEEGREIYCRLVKEMDVVVEGFRPGVAKRLGVDYETTREINPRIVYCSMSGYGQNGPYKDRLGHDINYIAQAGALSMIGYKDGPPVIPMNFLADGVTSLCATYGILLALFARERTGKGQYVDISYFDCSLAMLAMFVHDYFANGTIYGRGNSGISGGAAGYNIYETKDRRYITIGCFESHFWELICHLLGRDDLIPYQWNEGKKQIEISSYFKETFAKKTSNQWLSELKGIPVEKVCTIDEIACNPQVLERNMLVEIEHPVHGKEKHIGIAVKLSDSPGIIRTPAPTPGQHTKEILIGLGYTTQDIKELEQREIVKV